MSKLKKIKSFFGNYFRGYKKKWLMSLVVGFSVAFIFFFSGIVDIFTSNHNLIPIPHTAVIAIAAVLSLIVCAGVTAFLIIMPCKIFMPVVVFVMGIFLAGYLQGTFFNPYLGVFSGDEIEWEELQFQTFWSNILWISLIVFPLLLIQVKIMNTKTFKKIIICICSVVCGMQTVGVISNIIESNPFESKNFGMYLSADYEFEVSSNRNIMVFVVDRLDGMYVQAVRKDTPDFFDRLDGFTEFTNALNHFSWTYPSATYINTGVLSIYDLPARRYFERAWGESDYISLLQSNNFGLYYNMAWGFTYSNISQLEGVADNLANNVLQIEYIPCAKSLLNLTAFRYSPMYFKEHFWMAKVEFPFSTEEGGEIVECNDPRFYERFVENGGLTVQNRRNNYQFIHFNGSHSPFTMNEYAQADENSGLVQQTKGCFKIIYDYIDEMKRLGLYEDATIIITADHGYFASVPATIGLFFKPSGSAGTPLVQSHAPVTHDNLFAAVLESEGIEFCFEETGFAESFFDVAYDPNIIRYTYNFESNFDGLGNHRLKKWEVRGDANIEENWTEAGYIERNVFRP
jgi:hypothetical protein